MQLGRGDDARRHQCARGSADYGGCSASHNRACRAANHGSSGDDRSRGCANNGRGRANRCRRCHHGPQPRRPRQQPRQQPLPAAAPTTAPNTSPDSGARGPHGKPGGSLKVSNPNTLRQLTRQSRLPGSEYLMSVNVYNTLVFFDHDRTIKPELAESWTISDDLKTYTFKLRPGVKFHHGKDLDADDVIFTVKRLLDPATGCVLRSSLEFIEKMEAVDKLTVKMSLKSPYAELLAPLSSREASILPADRLDKLSTEPSGTGPFLWKEIVQGDHMTLVKNPNYSRPGLPTSTKSSSRRFRSRPRASPRSAMPRPTSCGSSPSIWWTS